MLQSCVVAVPGLWAQRCLGIAEASQIVPVPSLSISSRYWRCGCVGKSTGLLGGLGLGTACLGEPKQVWRAALEAGWPAVLKLLLTLCSRPQGGPAWCPYLPSNTTFFRLFCERVLWCQSICSPTRYGYCTAGVVNHLSTEGHPTHEGGRTSLSHLTSCSRSGGDLCFFPHAGGVIPFPCLWVFPKTAWL